MYTTLALIGAEKLPEWERQTGRPIPYASAFPGSTSFCHQIAGYDLKCPKYLKVSIRKQRTSLKVSTTQTRAWHLIGIPCNCLTDIGLEWYISNKWEKVDVNNCMFEKDVRLIEP